MVETRSIAAIIVAAGQGVRAGGTIPKQYRRVSGKPMLRHSVERLLSHPLINSVHVIIHPDHAGHYATAVEHLKLAPPVFGGAERADSVRAGLKALESEKPDYVLVHDAARPFISHAMLDRLIAKLDSKTGVVPALPVADTVRRAGEEWEEVSREGLLRIQTPQAFPYHLLVLAMEKAGTVTDEAAAWLAVGNHLEYVEGEEQLRKMTTEQDITSANPRRIATGQGFDVHELMPAGDKHQMRIGGIAIEHDHKLHGHSDADVVLHALVDALLGALGEGDIGAHFPPSDPKWKGADSKLFVAEAKRLVEARGGNIQHVDITIICEAPKIGPHREAMRQAIAAMLALPLAYVSIKATTTEGLGFTGRKEGIAAQATATLSLPSEN